MYSPLFFHGGSLHKVPTCRLSLTFHVTDGRVPDSKGGGRHDRRRCRLSVRTGEDTTTVPFRSLKWGRWVSCLLLKPPPRVYLCVLEPDERLHQNVLGLRDCDPKKQE